MIEIIFTRVWWKYDSASADWFTHLYHWFNFLEGCIWLVIAALIAWRFLKHRQTAFEVAYSLAFLTFAVTDFQESFEQSSWLIWLKIGNLIALFLLRRRVMLKHYPAARIF